MGNGTSPLAFLVLTILLKITSQQTVDICSGPTHLRAAGCAPEEEVIECNSEGKYCYIYDALLPFCPQHETFFDSPFGAIRAEGPPTCTTTTTGTFTVTTTYTRTATVFTSTRGQAIECRDFCYENTHPWIVKCGWSVCASCGECAAILLPSTSQATSSGQEGMFTTRPVRRNTTLPPTTSAASGGQSGGSGSGGGGVPVYKSDGSLEEAAQSDQTTVQGEATTSQELQSKACLKLCADAQNYIPWEQLCSWATCVLCPECSGTSVTVTSSTMPPIVTFTFSTTVVSVTSQFTTSSTTKSTTITRSTTLTTTNTATITSTTTDRACAPPTPGLADIMATEECKGNLSAGDFCVAQLAEHPCLYSGDLILQCPKNNILHRESELLSGDYQSKCRLCGWGKTDWEDTDPVGGKMTVSLEFGANALLGMINESVIFGYGIFLADNCSRPLKRDLIGYVPKMDPYPHDERCCTPNAYSTTVSFDVPPGYYSVMLMIRPNTSLGFLPLGEVTAEILDVNQTKAGIAGATRQASLFLSLLILSALQAALRGEVG